MLTFATRALSRLNKMRAARRPESRGRMADQFLELGAMESAGPPNQHQWFHAMPVPDGRRITGVSHDPSREAKLWHSCFGADRNCLEGKRVLDIGANDGFFTIASLLCGARSTHAVNTGDLSSGSFPANLRWASHVWAVKPAITVGNFLDLPPTGPQYDVVLFFGVLYHLENVYAAMRLLSRLLAPNGVIYLETQTTAVEADRPVLEIATDRPTSTVPQLHSVLNTVGNSNYLLPNPAAVVELAATYGLTASPLPANNPYERDFGGVGKRRVFELRHAKR